MYELMKPTPYLGTFPYPLVSWKGQTLKQITSSIQANGQVNPKLKLSSRSLMMPAPLKIYRREIAANISAPKCNDRNSSSINVFDQPGGSIINSSATNQNGLVNTIDDTFPKNTCERPGTCLRFLSEGENAKRRVRSSGMIKRQFDISKNNDTYYTDAKQYLVSRNRTFKQNQYNYIRQGNSNATPGTTLASANVYSPNGLSHCPGYTIDGPVSFEYKWIDATTNTVTLPAGSYRIEDVNSILQKVMAANNHYFISKSSQISIFLLSISYNDVQNVVELQTYPASTTIYPTSTHRLPFGVTWTNTLTSTLPQFIIQNNQFQQAIGLAAGSYPSTQVGNGSQSQTFLSTSTPLLNPSYVQIYYKPSNPNFANQGGVSSAEVTLRAKYNAIQGTAGSVRDTYGDAVADAMAYGSKNQTYTKKDKIGFPLPSYPKFTANGEQRNCSDSAIRG
jgi:hypothetical protein